MLCRRCGGVCRRLKRAAYDIDVIVRCVESGGVTEAARGAATYYFYYHGVYYVLLFYLQETCSGWFMQ